MHNVCVNTLKGGDLNSLAEHIFECEEQGIGLKTAVMEHAVMRRGLPYRRLNRYLILVEPPGRPAIAFYNMMGPSISTVGSYIADRKPDSRMLLREAGLSVPRTELFSKSERREAWEFGQQLEGGVVVKPTRLSRGRGVTTGIQNEDEFAAAWSRAFDAYRAVSRGRKVMVEEFFTGDDYRCFVVGGRFVSATQRRRPRVVGDGNSSVSDLIRQKNDARAVHPTLHTYPIPTDIEVLDALRESGHGLDYVPAPDEVVILRWTSNLSGGGDSVDCTETIHPGFREISVRAVEAIPGMGYLGVDIIASTVRDAPTRENHVVTEVETSPGPLTDFPVEGEPRDMAGAILEYYLPSGAD